MSLSIPEICDKQNKLNFFFGQIITFFKEQAHFSKLKPNNLNQALISMQQGRKIQVQKHLTKNKNNGKRENQIKNTQINGEHIFLREDMNELYDNMMVSTNFNLRKFSEKGQNQKKKYSKEHSIQTKIIKPMNETKPTKGTSESHQTQKLSSSFLIPNKKHSTTSQWNIGHETKKELIKTDNLNRLLRKRDSFSIANANKEAVSSKAMKTHFPGSSTFHQKEDENTPMKALNQKNIRSKMMSMTSKANRTQQRFQTEIVQQDQGPFSRFKTSKRIETQNNTQQNIQQRKNNYNELEKKFNKGGPLKFKHVQNWLNNIIQQYCHDQFFDGSLTSAALKKYYIDSNSLMSNGVDPADVSRIYNSLFVYSIGFNNLIKQISKGNRELVKNIWKVYSLLLQYCAAGNYETLVGEMERDKLQKVEELKMEIEKRQVIIEQNEELNEEKNMNMYKELKRLKDENFNLANQREILMEDFQQADQAFNQEVSLRLKFENTINQIYSVHKELENKHGRLFHDFQLNMDDLKKCSDKYFEQTKTSQKYKYELIELKEKYNELNKINSHDKEHIDVLLKELASMKENYFTTMKDLQKTKSISLEKDRKLQQMLNELENTKIILDLREKSSKQTHSEYQITLQENNKLFSVISQQRLQMQVLLKEKKDFNQNVLKILAESSYYKKKYDASESQIKALNQKLIDFQSQLHKTEVQNEISLKELQNYKKDLESNYESIKNMRTKNFELEEELIYLRRFEGSMDSVLQEKNQLIEQQKVKIDELQHKIMLQTHEFMNLESKHKILDTQLKAQKEMSMRRVEDFRKEQELMSTNESSLSKMLKQTNNEVDKFKTLLSNTLMDYKNEKFQRSNLTLAYEQILKVLEKKNIEEKQASIKINELEEEVNHFKEKYKLTHLNLLNTTDELNLKISHLHQKINNQKQVIDYKAHHQHPMAFEDICQKYQRQIESHQRTILLYERKLEKSKQQNSELLKQMKLQKDEFTKGIEKVREEFKKNQQKLRGEIEYEKEESSKMKKRLNTLQVLEATYKQKVTIYEHREADQRREQEMINQINQNNAKISLLRQQIEKIEDEKKEVIQTLHKRIKEVQNQKLDFVYEFKTKKQREIKEELDRKYHAQIEDLKTDYEQKIKKNRFKISPRLFQNTQGQAQQQQFNVYFKELIKNKQLEEILSIKKEQFQSKDQAETKRFYDQIEDFFKRSLGSQYVENLARANLMSLSKNSTDNDFIKPIYKNSRDNIPAYLQRIQNSEEFKKRGSITRKLKHAYDYYGKI